MLFAAADALLPPAGGAVGFDWVPGVEATLVRRGPAARARLRGLLRRLDWAPWVGLRGGRFWQLPRAARAAELTRRARRRGGADHRLLLALLAEAGAAVGQSASGA